MNILLEKTASFLIILFLGVILKKTGVLRREDKEMLSFLCMNVTLPVAIVQSFAGTEINAEWVAVAVIAFLLNWFSIGAGYFLSRNKPKSVRATWCLGFTGYNLGSFLIPMAQQMLPPAIVSLICIFDFGNGLMTLGGNNAAVSALLNDRKGFDGKTFCKKLFSAPALVTEALMIALSLLGVRVPGRLVNILTPVANANFFLSILLVGVMLDIHLPKDKLRQVLQIVGVRLVISVCAAAALWLWLPMDETVRMAVVFCCCAPISVMSSLYISKCGADESVSSMAYSVYVLISIFLMFSMMHLLKA